MAGGVACANSDISCAGFLPDPKLICVFRFFVCQNAGLLDVWSCLLLEFVAGLVPCHTQPGDTVVAYSNLATSQLCRTPCLLSELKWKRNSTSALDRTEPGCVCIYTCT